MENRRINGNDLIALGYKENHAMGVALKINKKRLGYSREQMLNKFRDVLHNPESYLDDKIFHPLAEVLLKIDTIERETVALKDAPDSYTVYGAEHIEEGAKKQMQVAMKLPVTVAGALMPDAH